MAASHASSSAAASPAGFLAARAAAVSPPPPLGRGVSASSARIAALGGTALSPNGPQTPLTATLQAIAAGATVSTAVGIGLELAATGPAGDHVSLPADDDGTGISWTAVARLKADAHSFLREAEAEIADLQASTPGLRAQWLQQAQTACDTAHVAREHLLVWHKEAQEKAANLDKVVPALQRCGSGLTRLERQIAYLTSTQELMAATMELKELADGNELATLVARFQHLEQRLEAARPVLHGTRALTTISGRLQWLVQHIRSRLEDALRDRLAVMKWPLTKGKLLAADGDNVEQVATVFKLLVKLECAQQRQVTSEPMWAMQAMARPVLVAFTYHFFGDHATNRIDKPEWYFSHVLEAIRLHEKFLVNDCQSWLVECADDTNEQVKEDALAQFIDCLIRVVSKKVSTSLPQLRQDHELLCHTLDELVQFEQTLLHEFSYGMHLDDQHRVTHRVIEVFTTDADNMTLWVQSDKRFAEERFRQVLESPTAWSSPLDSIGDVIPTLHVTRLTNVAQSVVSVIRAETERYSILNQPAQQLLFVRHVQRALLSQFRVAVEDAVVECQIEEALVTSESWRKYGALLTSVECVNDVLQEWAEDPFYVSLCRFESEVLSTEAKPLSVSLQDEVMSLTSEIARGGGIATIMSATGAAAARAAAAAVAKARQSATAVLHHAASTDGEVETKTTERPHIFRPFLALAAAALSSPSSLVSKAKSSSIREHIRGAAAIGVTTLQAAAHRFLAATEDRDGSRSAPSATPATHAPPTVAVDWRFAEGGLFASDLAEGETLVRAMTMLLVQVSSKKFQQAAAAYLSNQHQWSGTMASSLRATNDVTPTFCTALSFARVCMIQIRATISPRIFAQYVRGYAQQCADLLLQDVACRAHFSAVGAAQLQFDCDMLQQVFSPYLPPSVGCFKVLMDACRLLCLPEDRGSLILTRLIRFSQEEPTTFPQPTGPGAELLQTVGVTVLPPSTAIDVLRRRVRFVQQH